MSRCRLRCMFRRLDNPGRILFGHSSVNLLLEREVWDAVVLATALRSCRRVRKLTQRSCMRHATRYRVFVIALTMAMQQRRYSCMNLRMLVSWQFSREHAVSASLAVSTRHVTAKERPGLKVQQQKKVRQANQPAISSSNNLKDRLDRCTATRAAILRKQHHTMQLLHSSAVGGGALNVGVHPLCA